MPEEKANEGPSRKAHFALETTEPTSLGHGWISGTISAVLGVVGLGTVVCFQFPELTMPALRGLYPVPAIRGALHFVLVGSFLMGTISICLRHNKALGLIGITLTLLAALLGGSQVPLGGEVTTEPFLGLDWFLLNLIVYSVVYIPLERLFAKYPDQPTFRKEWRVDLAYFFFNTLFIQVTSFLVMQPSVVFFSWARLAPIQEAVSGIPLLIQIPLVLLVADLAQYWAHRAFHEVPALWRFHAIHHSVESMDWLAGARLHVVDAVVTRGLTYIPLYVLGFSQPAIYAYLVVVVVQSTFIHANVRWEFPRLRRFIATPCFHHWHHTAEKHALDKNYSVHSPLWDWLFGTLYLPDAWPKQYGICGERDVPTTWARQLVYPFRRRRRSASEQQADA